MFNKTDENRIARWESILSKITKPLRMSEIARLMEKHHMTIKRDIQQLVKHGYLQATGETQFQRRYLVLKASIDLDTYTPMGDKQQDTIRKNIDNQPMMDKNGFVKLQDRVHWTPRTKQSKNAWAGSTLGTMTF